MGIKRNEECKMSNKMYIEGHGRVKYLKKQYRIKTSLINKFLGCHKIIFGNKNLNYYVS